MSSVPRSRAAIIALVALISVPLLIGIIGWLAGWPLGMDSAVYRAGALTLLHGEPLYETDTLRFEPSWAQLPFTYPPAAVALFVPLAPLPLAVAWGALGSLSLAALAVIVALALRHRSDRTAGEAGTPDWLPARDAQTAVTLATVALTAAFVLLEPVWRTISLGQINLVLTVAIMLDVLVLCARRSRWGGVLIGAASAIKLTPLIFVAHLVVIGRWRDAVRALVTFLGLQAAMWLIIPGDVGRYWTQAVTDPDRIGTINWSDNQALSGLALRLTDSASWASTAALGVGVLLAPAAVWLVLRRHRAGDPLSAMLVTAFFGLLVSPVSWTHHWVWVVPLLTMLVARASTTRDWTSIAALVVVFGSYVLLVLPGGRDPDEGWSVVDHLLGNAYLVVPLVLGAVALAAGRRSAATQHAGDAAVARDRT